MGSGDRSTLVRICDPAGRLRGTGSVADDRGTVVTSHEAVDGLVRLVLYGTGDRSRSVGAEAITALPELDLALVRTGGLDVLGVEPLPIVLRDRIEPGTYVRVAAHGWRQARVLGVMPVMYGAAGGSHRVGAALELALGTDGGDALRLRGAAIGGPVLDPQTGAVIAVLGTTLRAAHTAAGFAVPLTGGEAEGPLGALLRRNATKVPGYGRDLNLAGALQLTAMSIGSAGGAGAWPDPVERPDTTAEFTAFTAAGERPEVVLGLVGVPGTGRTTELVAHAARRARGSDPALTVWLRGADLLAEDTSVADAIARTLGRAGRIVTAAELAVALPTHREPVIGAFRDRLTRPGDGAGEALRSLAGIDAPALALHAAGLVRAYTESHPDGGAHMAAYLDRRLERGPAARALLLPLVTDLLRDRPAPAPVRGALARVLAAPGTPASGVLRARAAGSPAGVRGGRPPGPGRPRRAALRGGRRIRPAGAGPYPGARPPHRDAAGPHS